MTAFFVLVSKSFCLLASIVVLTWNGKWFPSGRAEHRASAEAEARTIREAGAFFRDAIGEMDRAGTNDLIICFNEIRDREAAEDLLKEIGRTNLVLASISAYRRRDRFDAQQDAIATTLPVVSGSWSRWRGAKPRAQTPPRGFACAELLVDNAITARVYSVHMKSNYGATKEADKAINRAKRTAAARELLAAEKLPRGKKQRLAAPPVIVAGDFNADCWNEDFALDTIFDDFEAAGFANVLEKLPRAKRITYPGRGKWGDSAFDYIMIRGFEAKSEPKIFSSGDISDHDALGVELDR